jgi:hypothetical protein
MGRTPVCTAKSANRPYEVERRTYHAVRPGFRIVEMRIGPTQTILWHYHTEARDTFYVLSGSIRVRVRAPEAQVVLTLGEKLRGGGRMSSFGRERWRLVGGLSDLARNRRARFRRSGLTTAAAYVRLGSQPGLADSGSTDVRFAPKAEVSRTLPVPQGSWRPDRISNPSNKSKRVTSHVFYSSAAYRFEVSERACCR